MNLINATKMQAGYTMGMEPSGRELLVVVVKGTFTIPPKGEEAALSEEQLPLIAADEFSGEPGLSAPIYESDYAPRKHKCDVLLNGSAYSPNGRSVKEVVVSLQVGSMSKSFKVVGNRVWRNKVVAMSPGDPEPFVKMPFSYDNAFGGTDKTNPEPEKQKAYLINPAGKDSFSDAEF